MMLAQNFNPEKVKFPLYSQPKLDGIRCVAKKSGLYSRNGNYLHAPQVLKDLKPLFDLYPRLVLDGELYIHGVPFNQISSKSFHDNDLEFHYFDVIKAGKFSDRFNIDFESRFVKKVKTTIVNNLQEVQSQLDFYLSQGYEGQILRVNGKYERKRSHNLLKHKLFKDEEFTIVSLDQNALWLVNKGVFFKAPFVNPSKDLVGKSATIKYFEMNNGIPRFPSVIKVNRENHE